MTPMPNDRYTRDLDVYLVGGAVRDELLGLEPAERDYVVVGATPGIMTDRGFRSVGRDFPVFLHPESGEEYALARTERKQGRGYRGFEFHATADVALEQDLARRDLTVNAIARAPSGEVFDPFGGRDDLEKRLLRHISPAFSEDPVRVLRLARFAARFPDFSVHPETSALCREMVADGEVDHLVAERVWRELSRALMYDTPSRFFRVLRETGALARVLPEVDALFGVPQPPEHHPEVDTGEHLMLVLDQAARLKAPLPARFAALVHDLGKALTPADKLPSHPGHEKAGLPEVEELCRRLAVPRDCRDLGLLVCEFHLHVHRALEMRPETIVRLFERLDAFRRPERLEGFLLACEADARGRAGLQDRDYPQPGHLRRALSAAAGVNTGDIAAKHGGGPEIAGAIRKARAGAVAAIDRD